MLHSLQHLQLVVYHFLVALDIFLEDDLDGKLLSVLLGFPNNAISTSA